MIATLARELERLAFRAFPGIFTGLISVAAFTAGDAFSQSHAELPGPSSRRTPIAISEILYKPAPRGDGRNLEFIELYNSNPWPEDISGYRLAGQIEYRFPPSTTLPAQSYRVIAAVPADLQAVYGLANVLGPYTNTLKTSGSLTLLDERGAVLLDLEYDGSMPWPMGADGTGHSIVLARPSFGEADPKAWDRSSAAGGSPGAAETEYTAPLRNVMLNEVLAHTDLPDVDAIELYNHSNDPVDLSGCTLSDDPVQDTFLVPDGTMIPARGFVYFTESQLGFALNAAGETVYFKAPGGARVLDALRFGAQENGISYGRFPEGGDWARLQSKTFGTTNAAPLISHVGFNEIMYHPITGNDDEQYVELFNHGTNAVSLGGWKIGGGIHFTFPSNQVLVAKGYLVVARNATRLRSNYPQLNPGNTIGNFSGKLAGAGERITLSKPDLIVGGGGTVNAVDIVVDEVTYGTGGRWGRWSDGGGSSLELVDARSDKRLAANWTDSDESAKSSWTTVESFGSLDHGWGAFSPLQLGLLDAGECLVDNVEVLAEGTGPNLAGNPGFESGMTSLSFVGSHSRSSLASGSGYSSSTALRVRASDGIQTGPNAVQIWLTSSTLTSGQSATLRFKARWLRGCPEPLLRFWGCQLEATARLPVPLNLGTPALPNSRAKANYGPAIYQVRHDPAVPATNQPVVVTAKVWDPDGLTSVNLQYRFDPQLILTNVPMNDFGTNGDRVAGDGVYSATIPGRLPGAAAFIVAATDGMGATNRFPELVDDNAPLRECVVYFGDPNPTNLFGTYHLWLTQTNVNRWKALPVMSNEDIDGTLVYNNRVIYNMGGRYSGSPWHQNYDSPAGTRACHYIWSMPKDDLLLGASSFNKIHWPGNDIQQDSITSNVNDATLQREQAAYFIFRRLGLPWSYRRFVAVYVNGVRRGKLMEDALRPTGGLIKDQYLRDHSGVQLYKLQRWYEGSSTALISECYLQHYTTTGGAFKAARYRPNWGLKESAASLSDFTNVYALITAATAYNQSNYVALLENVADMENWIRSSAANHAVGNWDAFGSLSGQNVDAWLSDQQRWTLFTIDLSICLDNSISGVGLFSMKDLVWSRIGNTPKFRRMYCAALNELVNSALNPTVIYPVLDAKYSAFLAAGLNPASPLNTKGWISNQQASISSQLANINAVTFNVAESAVVASSNTVTLTGSAPVEIVSIRVNGVDYTPVWTTVTNWSLVIPAAAGPASWTIEARDRLGQPVGGSFLVSVENFSEPESPAENVVINEVMFNAIVPEAQYVELFNRAVNTTFDLSNWRLNGLDYTFPPGSLIRPMERLVLVRSPIVFAARYGALIPVFGVFNGTLQTDGETLSLIQPGSGGTPDLVVDRVRYEAVAPWPDPVASPGRSLQLIDAARDNSRVSNWAAGAGGGSDGATPGTANAVSGSIPAYPTLWLNEVQRENLTGPADNFGEREPWVELYNAGTEAVSLSGLYLGTNYGSPAQWAFPSDASLGPGEFAVIWLDGQPLQTAGMDLHANFRLTTGSLALSRFVDGSPQLVDYLNFDSVPSNFSYGDVPDGQPFYRRQMFYVTPGNPNDAALPPITVTINEWMAENDGFRVNPWTGLYDDWFELHNAADVPASLAGYYLSDTLANRFKFQIPAGFQIPANGFLVVWADETTAANTNTAALHASFKLSKGGEAIVLSTPEGVAVDAVTFGAQVANVSEARFPDSGALRLFTPTPTPGASNIPPPASAAPVITGVTLQPDGSCVFRFAASPGHTYRIEYKNDLSEPDWWPLGVEVFASETMEAFSDVPAGERRFYRVVLGD